MRGFLLKLLLFAVIIAVLDFGYGLYGDSVRKGVRNGVTGLDNEALYHTTAPMLVFGSSRAWHHYDTRILRDSLGMDIYNCGVNSMGVQFFYPRLQQILRRYTPRVIIYDSSPVYDCVKSTSDAVTARRLQPYFCESEVYRFMRELSLTEWIKCHSATYRYHDRLSEYRADADNHGRFYDGYQPLTGTKSVKTHTHESVSADSVKVRLLHRFINLCHSHDIKLIFVISPYYKADMGPATEILKQAAAEHGVPVIDRFNDSVFMADSTLFFDESHLNSRGATRFTRTLIPQIKPYLSKF